MDSASFASESVDIFGKCAFVIASNVFSILSRVGDEG